MHIIRFIFYKGGSLQGDFSIKPSERVNSLVCISVRIKVNEWINKTTPNTQWSLSVFCSLPPPSISPSCQPSFTADSEICLSPRPALSPSHAALVPDIKWPLNPPRSAQVPTSSFEQPPALPRLAPHGDARHLPVWERRRSWTLCPSVSGSYWPVTPSSTYYSVQGERRREKTSRGKTSEHEREREVRKHFHGFQMLYCLCQIAPQIHVTGFIHQCLRCNHYHII